MTGDSDDIGEGRHKAQKRRRSASAQKKKGGGKAKTARKVGWTACTRPHTCCTGYPLTIHLYCLADVDSPFGESTDAEKKVRADTYAKHALFFPAHGLADAMEAGAGKLR